MTTLSPPTDAEASATEPPAAPEVVRPPIARTVALVALAMVVGFAIRWYAVTVAYPTCPPTPLGAAPATDCFRDIEWGDAFYYNTQAQLLADGHGFTNPTAYFQSAFKEGIDPYQPGAGHPPVYTTFLAGLNLVGLDTIDEHRRVEVGVGVLGVALMILFGVLLVVAAQRWRRN